MTTYTVEAHSETHECPDFESAARLWDGLTHAAPSVGGISVKTYRDGVCIRDGWLIHVRTDGATYVNPNLKG